MPKDYLPLTRSHKNAYPFRLASTSFIYPDHIIPNVEMLAPYLDEIELLLLESAPPESVPSKHEIETLARIASDTGITYNVHLPVDIDLGHFSAAVRQQAVEVICRIMELTAPLTPSTHTLHIDCECSAHLSETSADTTADRLLRWQERVHQSMLQLMARGISGRSLSVETLMYPFEWVASVIADFDLAVCIDMGHLILRQIDPEDIFVRYRDKAAIVHLHGVYQGRDHIALNRLPLPELDHVMGMLKGYEGVVSLEVFAYDALESSLKFLAEYWQNRC